MAGPPWHHPSSLKHQPLRLNSSAAQSKNTYLHQLKPARSFMMVSVYGYFDANDLPVINKEL